MCALLASVVAITGSAADTLWSGVNHAAVLRVILRRETARLHGRAVRKWRFMKESHAPSRASFVRFLPFYCRNRYLIMRKVLAVGGDCVLLCWGLLQ